MYWIKAKICIYLSACCILRISFLNISRASLFTVIYISNHYNDGSMTIIRRDSHNISLLLVATVILLQTTSCSSTDSMTIGPFKQLHSNNMYWKINWSQSLSLWDNTNSIKNANNNSIVLNVYDSYNCTGIAHSFSSLLLHSFWPDSHGYFSAFLEHIWIEAPTLKYVNQFVDHLTSSSVNYLVHDDS